VIFESHHWKESLLKRARELSRQTVQRRWSEAAFAKLERNALIGFYEVRKLIEARKLSTSTAESTHRVLQYSAQGKPVHRFNWHQYGELYDLQRGAEQELKLPLLCNQFVHSYVFGASFGDGGRLDGVFVSSDHKRRSLLFLVPLTKIVEIFELVGRDYPSDLGPLSFNESTGDYQTV
jgi:hypothetical protein